MNNYWSRINTALLLSISAQLTTGWYRTATLTLAIITTIIIIATIIGENTHKTCHHKDTK